MKIGRWESGFRIEIGRSYLSYSNRNVWTDKPEGMVLVGICCAPEITRLNECMLAALDIEICWPARPRYYEVQIIGSRRTLVGCQSPGKPARWWHLANIRARSDWREIRRRARLVRAWPKGEPDWCFGPSRNGIGS